MRIGLFLPREDYEKAPTAGTGLSLPTAGGHDWLELGEVVRTEVVGDRIKVILEIRDELDPCPVGPWSISEEDAGRSLGGR